MNRIEEYLCRVLEISELSPEDDQVEELRSHLADLVHAFEDQGLLPTEAEEAAIRQFGVAERVGRDIREVTPLRVRTRDWYLMAPAALLGGILFVPGLTPTSLPQWPILILLMGALAFIVRQPIVGALSPLAGVLVAQVLDTRLFLHVPDKFFLLYIGLEARSLLLLGFMVGIPTALAGLAIAWLRGNVKFSRHIDLNYVLAGLVHLLPFSICYGLSGATFGTAVAVGVWFLGRRSQFLTRHALQAGVLSLGAIVSQLLLYRINVYAMSIGIDTLSSIHLVGVAIMIVRVAFGLMAAYGALAGFSGHAFRYPFARLLFRGTRWRLLKQT